MLRCTELSYLIDLIPYYGLYVVLTGLRYNTTSQYDELIPKPNLLYLGNDITLWSYHATLALEWHVLLVKTNNNVQKLI